MPARLLSDTEEALHVAIAQYQGANARCGLWKALQAGLADWQRRTDATRHQLR